MGNNISFQKNTNWQKTLVAFGGRRIFVKNLGLKYETLSKKRSYFYFTYMDVTNKRRKSLWKKANLF